MKRVLKEPLLHFQHEETAMISWTGLVQVIGRKTPEEETEETETRGKEMNDSMPIRLVDNAAENHGENSPALQCWEQGIQGEPSPEGTKEAFLPSLAGLDPHRASNPAMNRWAILKGALSTNRISMNDSYSVLSVPSCSKS